MEMRGFREVEAAAADAWDGRKANWTGGFSNLGESLYINY
jgi:hypothetical protein